MAGRVVRAAPHEWERVAEYVYERRAALDLTAQQVVERAGPGLTTGVLSIIENHRQESYTERTLRALCAGLGWSMDSVQRIIRGGEPEEADEQPARQADDRPLSEMFDDVMRRLEELERKQRAWEEAQAGDRAPERNG